MRTNDDLYPIHLKKQGKRSNFPKRFIKPKSRIDPEIIKNNTKFAIGKGQLHAMQAWQESNKNFNPSIGF